MDLVVLGHLLQHVGEAVVGELLGDLDHALVGQVEQGVREVGGLEVGERRDELLGRLGLAGRAGPRGPRATLAKAAGPFANGEAPCGPSQEELADIPLAGPVALDRDVLDDGGRPSRR